MIPPPRIAASRQIEPETSGIHRLEAPNSSYSDDATGSEYPGGQPTRPQSKFQPPMLVNSSAVSRGVVTAALSALRDMEALSNTRNTTVSICGMTVAMN